MNRVVLKKHVEGELPSIEVWNPNNDKVVEVYKPTAHSHPEANPDFKLEEKVTSHALDGEVVCLGLNTSRILRIDSDTGELVDSKKSINPRKDLIRWDKFFNKDRYDQKVEEKIKILNFKKKQNIPLDEGLNHRLPINPNPVRLGLSGLIDGFQKVSGMIVDSKGRLLATTSAGVYDYDSEQYLTEGFMHSIVLHEGKPCFVSLTPGLFQEIGSRTEEYQHQPSALTDLETGDVIMENLVPKDGMGGRPGTYILHNGIAYIKHGDWPFERITKKDINTGETLSQMDIPTSSDFYLYNGQVCDVRRHHDYAALTSSSEEDYLEKSIFIMDDNSLATHTDLGILITKYEPKKGQTVISALDGEQTTREISRLKGNYTLL